MPLFRLEGAMRYTRHSCMPMRARLELAKLVQAEDAADAVRQAALCLDRDLEQLLATVNAINVSDVLLEILAVCATDEAAELWNPIPFAAELRVPAHIVVEQRDPAVAP